MAAKNLPNAGIKLAKIAVGGAILVGLGMAAMAYAQAKPLPVAETFTFRDELGHSLSDLARLDTLVTVVDAAAFLADYQSSDSLAERGSVAGEEDNRALVELLIEQVEFCNVIVLNKIDRVSPADRLIVRAILQRLNPRGTTD